MLPFTSVAKPSAQGAAPVCQDLRAGREEMGNDCQESIWNMSAKHFFLSAHSARLKLGLPMQLAEMPQTWQGPSERLKTPLVLGPSALGYATAPIILRILELEVPSSAE